jgi:hypothetical protein
MVATGTPTYLRHDSETDLDENGLSYRAKPITLCCLPEKAARTESGWRLASSHSPGLWYGVNRFEADVGSPALTRQSIWCPVAWRSGPRGA